MQYRREFWRHWRAYKFRLINTREAHVLETDDHRVDHRVNGYNGNKCQGGRHEQPWNQAAVHGLISLICAEYLAAHYLANSTFSFGHSLFAGFFLGEGC